MTGALPEETEPVYLAVGKFSRTHGVRGDILFTVLTDFPERLRSGKLIYVGEERKPLRIRRRREHASGLILGFNEYHDREGVDELKNQVAYVKAADLPPLEEGEYYHHQLLGIRVEADSGETLGELVDILENPANDIYVVRPEKGPDILLPAIDPVILEIDLEQQVMRVHLLPGLLPG
jgi:16S rRNA processing protein RimM